MQRYRDWLKIIGKSLATLTGIYFPPREIENMSALIFCWTNPQNTRPERTNMSPKQTDFKEETVLIKINTETLEYSADIEMCNRDRLIIVLRDLLYKLEVMNLGPNAEAISANDIQ